MAYQPKSYRKFIATAATATIVASAVAPAASAASVSDFKDVAPKYLDAVSYLVANGITQGTTDTTFGTHDNVKRGDAAIWLAKALKLDLTNVPASGFTDTGRYDAAVSALKSEGVLSGKTATTFAPNALLTRGEMAKILANAYELTSDTDVPFTDLGPNFGPYIKALYEYEVTQGKTATTFGTSMNITRGDLAIFLKRAAEVVKTPEVASVTATSATQVEVKFTQPVSKDSLFTNGKSGAFKANTVSFTTLTADAVPSGTLTGELSADGKTLTVTSQNALSKRYDVVIDNLKTTAGTTVAKFNQVVTFAADTTAPTIVSTTKNSAGSFTVKFSEPLKSLGNVSYKLANGTAVAINGNGVSNDFTVGADEVTFTLGSDVAVGKEVIATFIGAQDQASNLLTPNPATVSFVKGEKDGTAPTVTAITQTDAKKFSVKFSEQLLSAPTVSVGNVAGTVTKDDNDPTLYHVAFPSVLDGTVNVSVSSYTDLSGEAGSTYTKVVTFVKDTVAPKVTSSAVVTDSTNNKQYLEVTFDKDVVLTTATVDGTGSYVKDYITHAIGVNDLAPTAISLKANTKNVVRVELDTFLGTTFDVENGAYTLNLAFSGVESSAGVAVGNAQVTFTRGKDGVAANNDLVSVASIVQDQNDNDKVLVTFNKPVDGASAVVASNYRIDGAVVESVTLKPASNGTQVAVLNLREGSNAFTGTRNIYVSGVKALGSTKVMETYHTNQVTLKENIAPVVTAAKLTATNEITFTFSENVNGATAADFEVLVGGQSQSTEEKVNVAVGSTLTNTATATISAVDATKLSKGLSLKALSTLDIYDAAGNKLSVPTNITVAQ
ncbi:S-layer homology domain-containing protein [Bacillus infantis]|uniref:S-layer homology domain-containing protein n=1 Tax=Bacillus infantis TaxID=324767 RepID=UPI001CD4F7F7|nr:S-layer homology domain-containing protein [Bacillus infantis]MCA1033469.1 S-layer homology domain-containing protein [Bacillus infantis]